MMNTHSMKAIHLMLWLTALFLAQPTRGASWLTNAPMSNAREYHTATLLSNGKVLIAGGDGVDNSIASSEIFDPATGAFVAAADLGTARQLHTATLLGNGKVLVIGGYNINDKFLASAEIYDPATDTWTATSPLAQARQTHTATLLTNGKVLVTGGYNPDEGEVSSADYCMIRPLEHGRLPARCPLDATVTRPPCCLPGKY